MYERRFLPTQDLANANADKLAEEFKRFGVTPRVRVCEATLDTPLVEKEGNHVLNWPFTDVAPPSNRFFWLLSLWKITFHAAPGCFIAVCGPEGLGRLQCGLL